MLKAILSNEQTDRLTRGLAVFGLSPNAWTIISLLPALAGLAALAMHHLATGLLLFGLSGAIDMVDGAVARATGKVSAKGSFLDGVVDRYVELLLCLGLLLYLGRFEFFGLPSEAWFVLLIFGSIMTSFVRAYADHRGVVKDPGGAVVVGAEVVVMNELQGLKRGVLELADALVVNKADGEQKALAERTRGEHARALELLRPLSPAWRPRVLTASALHGEGIAAFWDTVLAHHSALAAAGELERRRRSQARDWMWALVREGLQHSFRAHPEVAARIEGLEAEVEALATTPAAAARALLAAFEKR